MGVPKVLNKRHNRSYSGVYIGRPSIFGNPFIIGADGNREEVIEKYRQWVKREMSFAEETEVIKRTGYEVPTRLQIKEELKGRNLICWCAPLPCHGDILLQIANE